METTQDLIYFALDIGQQVDIAYDEDIKGFLVLVGDNSEYKPVIRMKQLLIKKRCSIKNSKLSVALDVGNNLWL